jgi:pimeloyl-ACP methyl ester carboxylesterase
VALPPGASERFVHANGIRLHLVEAGPATGPPVVLLHGFPELWYGWRGQIGPQAAAGFRVIVPDQRGYNTSDKPAGVAAYRVDALAADVVGLLHAAGLERASIVGHDWGGVVAWWLGLAHPERVERLAILNVPHPAVMRRHLLSSPRQMLRSWYVFFFQLPGLPERFLARDDFANLARAVRGGRRGTCTDEDLGVYREAWAQPGTLTAMVNWYRAAFRSAGRRLSRLRVSAPTLVLWGARDRFLGREMAEASVSLCDDGRLEIFETATHWLQHDEADAVNDRLVRFLAGVPTSRPRRRARPAPASPSRAASPPRCPGP